MKVEIPNSGKPVCHLNLARGYRGGERQTELLIRELARRGISQRLVVRHGHELLDRCADVPGLDCRSVHSNPVAAAIAARGSLVSHSHEARTVYSGLIGAKLFGVPYIITRRVVAPQSASLLRSLAFRNAAAIVAISRAVADALAVRYPRIKTSIIPDAVADLSCDDKNVAAIRARYPGKTIIGNVGALDHSHKGQLTIIEAARLAEKRHPSWQFLICGSGKDEELYREKIGALRNVELVGWVDNVGDYLAAFDLFLYPSLHEALGSTLLDAMQFGLPVVATDVDGIPDVISDGENGRLIPVENPSAMLATIAELLDSPGRIESMRKQNQARAASYTAARMADAYSMIYDSIRPL